MGKHRAPEEESVPLDQLFEPTKPIAVQKADRGLIKVYKKHCQPLYKRYRKFIIAAINAALIALFAVISDGVTSEEWLYIGLSAGAAIGVCAAPNAPNKKVEERIHVNMQ